MRSHRVLAVLAVGCLFGGVALVGCGSDTETSGLSTDLPTSTDAGPPTSATETSGAVTVPSTATPDGTSPRYVVAGGGALTEWQQQMVEVVEGYVKAWQANDGDAAAAFMRPEAVVEYPQLGGTYLPSDGTLQARISGNPAYRTLRVVPPMTVHGNQIALPGIVDSMSLPFTSIIQFTANGEPKITRETILLGR
jgi:hypothetical protein